MSDITHDRIYDEFCQWSPEHAKMVTKYKPWGSTSIVIWCYNGHAYKVKRYSPNKFIIQYLSEEDIKRKFENKN